MKTTSQNCVELTITDSKKRSRSKDDDEKKRKSTPAHGRPKRPLNSYNLFFKQERAKILGYDCSEAAAKGAKRTRQHRRTHGMISFSDLGKEIANRWNTLDGTTRAAYEAEASILKDQYFNKVALWKQREKARKEAERGTSEAGSHNPKGTKTPRVQRKKLGKGSLSSERCFASRARQIADAVEWLRSDTSPSGDHQIVPAPTGATTADILIDPETPTSELELGVFGGAERRRTLMDLGHCLFEEGRAQLMWEVLLNVGAEHLAKDEGVLQILCGSNGSKLE